jgi:hypothetical protein
VPAAESSNNALLPLRYLHNLNTVAMANTNKGLTDDEYAELAKALDLLTDTEQKKHAGKVARRILAPWYKRKDKINLEMYGTGKSPVISWAPLFDSFQ